MVVVSDPLGVAAILGALTVMKVPLSETWWETMRQLFLPLFPEKLSALLWVSSVLLLVR